jgi:hypothetical protein
MVRRKESRTSLRSTYQQHLHASLVQHQLVNERTEGNNPLSEESDEHDFSALRLALEESGTVCRLFGLYLGTRIDLLPIDVCLELSRIPGTAPATAWSQAQEFVEQELGNKIDQEFLAVEPVPYRTSLLVDSYLGMLKTGETVSLEVLRNEFRSFPDDPVEALWILSDCTIFQHWSDFAMRAVINDFAGELRLRLDQLETAATYEALAADDGDASVVPQILRKYCRQGVLVLEQKSSMNWSFPDDRGRNSEPNIPFTRGHAASNDKAAPTLCLSWLRLALHGRAFPVTFRLDDVALLQDGRTTFRGGIFAPSWPESAETLWRYLIAAAADDPDECCDSLLSMMTNAETSAKRSDQSHRDALAAFRQSVTYFMSAPGQQDFCSGMAARLLRQLQIATELGYRPKPFLVSFYRGLFSVLSVVRELQPQGDPVLEGLEGVWMTNILGSAGKVMRMDPLVDMGSKYLAAMMEFPVKLDAALSTALRRNHDVGQDWQAEKNDPPHAVSVVIIMVAVFLLFRYGPVHFPSVWVDRLSFSIWCLIGILVLRLAARPQ